MFYIIYWKTSLCCLVCPSVIVHELCR